MDETSELYYVVSITPTLRQRLQIAITIGLFAVFVTLVALAPDRGPVECRGEVETVEVAQ